MGSRGRPRHPDVLTPREWEVLGLLRKGLTNEQIAERLGVSFATARYHVSEILSKLGVSSREEAARWQPEPERRAWWRLAWPLTALKAAGVALAAAMLVGLGVLAWGLLRSESEDDAIVARPSPSAVIDSTDAPSVSPTATAASPPTLAPGRDGIRLSRGVYRVDSAGGEPVLLVEAGGLVQGSSLEGSGLVFSSDRNWFAVRMTGFAEPGSFAVRSVDGEPGGLIEGFEGVGVHALAPGAKTALVGAFDGQAVSPMLWHRDDGAFTQFLDGRYEVRIAEWSPGGGELLFSGWSTENPNEAFTYLVDDLGHVDQISSGSPALAWAPGGSWAVLASYQFQPVYRWDRHSGLTKLVDSPPDAHVTRLSVSPDGRSVLYSTSDRSVYVVDSVGGEGRFIAKGRDAVWSPDGSAIAFVRNRTPYVRDLVTGVERALVEAQQPFAATAEWLPDGSGVVFAYAPTLSSSVGVIDLETDDEWKVAYGNSPAWSPDGEHLAFIGDSGGGGLSGSDVIVTARADGSDLRGVSGYTWNDIGGCVHGPSPAWSSDGRWLAHGDLARDAIIVASTEFVDHHRFLGCTFAWSRVDGRLAIEEVGTPEPEIWIVGTDTWEREQVTYGADPSWSPDGRSLAVRRGESSLVVVDVSSGEEQTPIELPGGPVYPYSMAWSPGGRYIVLTRSFKDSEVSSHNEIVLVNPKARTAERLTNGTDPAWSPEGERLVFSRSTLDGYMVYVVDLQTREPLALTLGRNPDWSPDGTRIAFTR